MSERQTDRRVVFLKALIEFEHPDYEKLSEDELRDVVRRAIRTMVDSGLL